MKPKFLKRLTLITSFLFLFSIGNLKTANASGDLFEKFGQRFCPQMTVNLYYVIFKNCPANVILDVVLENMTETNTSYYIVVCDGGIGLCQFDINSCGPEIESITHHRTVCV